MDTGTARHRHSTGRTFVHLATSVLLPLLVGAVVLAVDAAPLAGQYFGRNKVQYDDFDFQVLETEHFRVHFYGSQSEQAIEDVARMAERWYGRLARTFEHAFREKKPLIFYSNQPDFQQTNVIGGFISQGTGGVTEGLKNRVVMPFAESYGETHHVLGHELVHAFQYDMAQAGRGGGATGFQRLPLWSVEGLAEYLSVGRRSSHTAMWMRDAVLRDDVPTIEQMSRTGEYFPYRFGHALWAYVGGRFGDESVTAFYRTAARQGLKSASEEVLGLPLDTLSEEWRRDTRDFYARAMEGRSDPNEVGSRIVPRELEENPGLHISPSVSPDGSRIVYLGQREVFSVDLWVADARTGEVQGRLATANANPHLDQLAYMNTSGTWSPDGRRFAFVTYAQGDNQIAVANVEERTIVERYPLEEVGGIYSMDWSPEGERIVFSGTSGGVTNLYMLDLERGTARKLTDDRWSELHPSFSPDGSTVAFSTDRGDAGNLRDLLFPRPGLGFLDLESGGISVRRPFENAKHIDPKWSPDGSSLYFVSDRDGFSDIYRLALRSGSARRVTRVATGVSGITELSPALTVAREGGAVLFTVFRDGGYTVQRLSAQESRGQPLREVPRAAIHAGMLPPRNLQQPIWVAQYLQDPAGLPPAEGFEVSDYDAGLALDYVAQPTGGVSVDRFGTSLGGSVAAFFSDMLGDHQLGVAVQANGRVKDIGGQVAYANRDSRTNWTLQGGRIPYRTAFARRGTGELNGQQLRTIDLIIDRTILNRATAGLRYPFSLTRRFEADAGATHIGFDRERLRTYFAPTGQPVAQEDTELPSPAGLNLYHASAALVLDRSFMAFTSPVRGARGRLEVEGNTGDLTFANVLADYRHYFFLNPLTLAFRGFHYGRYGTDADNNRLTPIFLGFDRYVRGYNQTSFNAGECTLDPSDEEACPEFDRLVGSRMAVASAELRIPLNGTDQFGLLDWGTIPVELSIFADAGAAWTAEESPELTFERSTPKRVPVFSYGASARFNLLGRMVFEVYYAHPFQRPQQDWVWGFQLAPGW